MVGHLVGIALSLSACSMAIDVSATGAQTFSPGPTAREPEITASGRGETHLPPTFAVVMIGVTTRAGTAADALSALANLGFKPAEASAAVNAAQDDLGPDADLDALVRLALRKAAK